MRLALQLAVIRPLVREAGPGSTEAGVGSGRVAEIPVDERLGVGDIARRDLAPVVDPRSNQPETLAPVIG